MRLPFLAAALLLALTPGASDEEGRPVLGRHPAMHAVRVAIDPADPARRKVGALTYLGGLRLTSRDRAFGGFSSMRVVGEDFLLLSDGGNLVRFRMAADMVPRDLRFGDLPGGPGRGWHKKERDSESLAWDPATGKFWVGFEYYTGIARFDSRLSRIERLHTPRAMKDWPVAGGPESMVRLRSGQFVVIAETARPKGRPDARIGLVFAGDPTEPGPPPRRFAYVPPAHYDPSDVAQLPDGRLLVLNRRLSFPALFTAKLTLIDLRGQKPGAVLRGREIATLAAPLLHDNYEALAVTREGDSTILWIASDDNGEAWEWSLLLKFRLDL